MSDEKPLLDTIIARPEQDAPRLIYADWLDDNGQPERAELIRVQIALAGGHNVLALKNEQLRQRENELLTAHGKEWAAPLTGNSHSKDISVSFRRGFAEIAELNIHHASHLAALCQAAPLTEVNLTGIADLAKTQALAEALPNTRITSLNLGDSGFASGRETGLAQTQSLAAALPSTRITSLHLGKNSFGYGQHGLVETQVLAAALPNTRITWLHLGHNGFGHGHDAMAKTQALARMGAMRLQSIHLGDNTLTSFHTCLREAFQNAAQTGTAAMFSLCEVDGIQLPEDILALRDAARAAYEKAHTPGIALTDKATSIVQDAQSTAPGTIQK